MTDEMALSDHELALLAELADEHTPRGLAARALLDYSASSTSDTSTSSDSTTA